MISDEMRELMSAYVDGELRDTDAARVEEMTKRDPELRREIEAYRTLRRKLKDWDEADHSLVPSERIETYALTRVRQFADSARQTARGRLLAALFSPVALAAGLLLAAGLGVVAAWPDGDAARIGVEPAEVAIRSARPLPDVRLQGTALQEYEAPERVFGTVEPRLQHFIMSENAWSLRELMRRDEERFERIKQRRLLGAGHDEPYTSAVKLGIAALISGYKAETAPREGLVVVTHPALHVGAVGRAHAVPAASRWGLEGPDSKTTIIVEAREGGPFLTPLGEVWVAVADHSKRTRVVSASNWVATGEHVKVVWTDSVARPRNYKNLEVQGFILGPKARKRLLGAKTKDAAFLRWLRGNYGGRSLRTAFATKAKERDAIVSRLVASLSDEADATGFAVVDGEGRVLGIELFQSHRLMVEFASRLLHGYVMEAGVAGVSVRRPGSVHNHSAVKLANELLNSIPQPGSRIEIVERGQKQWPKPLRRVNLYSKAGEVLGHGLVRGSYNRPVHVTIFGE